MGGNSTVIRAGFGLRNFTEPYQFFWDEASDYGSFFYQFFNLTANTSGQPGTFAPGSLSLGNTLPANDALAFTGLGVTPGRPIEMSLN